MCKWKISGTFYAIINCRAFYNLSNLLIFHLTFYTSFLKPIYYAVRAHVRFTTKEAKDGVGLFDIKYKKKQVEFDDKVAAQISITNG